MINTIVEQFIIAKIKEYDPNISTTTGSPIYQKVILPIATRLGDDPLTTDIGEFIVDRLVSELPDLDSDNSYSFIQDFIVKPLLVILEPYIRELVQLRTTQSINNYAAMTDEEVDNLAANLFIFRDPGNLASGIVQAYFSSPQLVNVDGGISFISKDGLAFTPQETKSFFPKDFKQADNLYYIDIAVISVIPHIGANIPKNNIKNVIGLSNVIKVGNKAAFTKGVTEQSKEQFVLSIKNALTERSLNTKRGIETFIRQNFSGIKYLDVVGYRDAEMQRDVIKANADFQSEEYPSAITYTTLNMIPIELELNDDNATSPIIGGWGDLDFKFTNKFRIVGAIDKFSKILDSVFMRTYMVEEPDSYKESLLTLHKYISDTEVPVIEDDDVIVTTKDFTLLGYGPEAIVEPNICSPNVLQVYDDGQSYNTGANLPMTNMIRLTGFENYPHEILVGQDFLILARANELISFPLDNFKQIINNQLFIRILRNNSCLNNLEVSNSSTFSTDHNLMIKNVGIEILGYGSPDYHEDEPLYDGVASVPGGVNGGVSLSFGILDTHPFVSLSNESPIDWEDFNIDQYTWISLSAHNTDGEVRWNTWGQVVVVDELDAKILYIKNIDYLSLLDLTDPDLGFEEDAGSYAFSDGGYKLSWTLYRGERELVFPDEKILNVYDEFSFFRNYPSTLEGDAKSGLDDLIFPGIIHSVDTPFKWAIIRLDKNIFTHKLSTSKYLSSELAGFYVATSLEGTNVDMHDKYTEVYEMDATDYLLHPITLPVARLQYLLNFDDFDDLSLRSLPGNTYSVFGLLVPSYYTDINPNITQFFEANRVELDDVKITVSDIPGSYPFDQDTTTDLIIDNNEIHIGGMTDIYISGGIEKNNIASYILYPDDITSGDVLLTALDGYILSTNKRVFYSSELNLFMNNNSASYPLVIQIIESSNEYLVNKTFIIDGPIDSESSAFLLNEEVDITSDELNLTFKLIKEITLSISSNKHILKSGKDILIPHLENKVFFTSGINFIEKPSELDMFLEIKEGESKGKYRVLSVTPTYITVDSLLKGPYYNTNYEIYHEQTNVKQPLITIDSINLGGEDSNGINIPYKNVIDCVSSSFYGLNNDPQTFTVIVGKNDDGAVTFTNELVDFVSENVTKYDVVKVENIPINFTYFIVDNYGFEGDANTITMSSQFVPEFEYLIGKEVTIKVGHPTIGNLSLYFKDRTYCEFNSDTLITDKDAEVLLRPSPAEESEIKINTKLLTDIYYDLDSHSFVSSDINFISCGVKSGDYVELITRVIYGDWVDGDSTFNLSGKTLVFTVDSIKKNVTFTGTGELTLEAVAIQINNKFGNILFVKVEEDDEEESNKRLVIYSKSNVQILQGTSSTVLNQLGLTQGQSTALNNLQFKINEILYDVEEETFSLDVADIHNDLDVYDEKFLFIKIIRKGVHIFYPDDFTQDSNGFYIVNLVASSFEAQADTKVIAGQQLIISNYKSYGYELITENENYTFSKIENLSVKFTNIIIPDYGVSQDEKYYIPNSIADINYAFSSLVSDIQDFVLSDYYRVVCNNVLVKHFLPAYLYLSINYSGGVSEVFIKDKLNEFLATENPSNLLESFDLQAVLSQLGATYVKQPQEIVFFTQDKNRNYKLIRSIDSVTLSNLYKIVYDSIVFNIKKV